MANCIHGVDERFCAQCASPKPVAPKTALTEVLWCLNDTKTRATYGAVAECIGVIPQAMGDRLGLRRPEASWVVSAASGFPEGYSTNEMHAELFRTRAVLSSGPELIRHMARWRFVRRT